jgi:hypothetical protein
MRFSLLITGAALALAACGNNDQSDNTQNVDENLSAENIVSNDVTAIDAVTSDAANMAADVEFNVVENSLDNGVQNDAAGAGSPKQPAPRRPRQGTLSPAPDPTTNTASNSE